MVNWKEQSSTLEYFKVDKWSTVIGSTDINESFIKQNKRNIVYLNMARVWAMNSYCKRKKTGAIIVNNNSIVADGYNGTPTGFSNICEENEKTLDLVLHAEANAISKLAKSTNSAYGSVIYCTLSPCIQCAKLIYQSGIKKLYTYELYRETSGLDFLLEAGIEINFISEKIVFGYLDENL